MRLNLTWLVAIIVALTQTGCNVGSGGYTYPYDGTWTASYNNAADWPLKGEYDIVLCTKPDVSLTIIKGMGSTKQTLTCNFTSTILAPVTKYLDYLISISISDTGVTNAIVNGYPLEGTCISTVGCSALSGSTALSLTR